LDTIDEDVDLSGYCHDALPGDPILFGCLTVIQTPPHGTDRRTVLAVGPFDIAVGEAQRILFAFVGGASESEILANAEAAQCAPYGCGYPPANEPTSSPASAALHAPAPNPARGATALSFT